MSNGQSRSGRPGSSRNGGPSRGGQGRGGYGRGGQGGAGRGSSRDDSGRRDSGRGGSGRSGQFGGGQGRDDRRWEDRGAGGQRRDDRDRNEYRERDDRGRAGQGRSDRGRGGERREEFGGAKRRSEFRGGQRRDDRRFSTEQGDRQQRQRNERQQERQQERDAVKKAAQQRPKDGYSLADFDDIPFNPDHRPNTAAPAPARSSEGVRLQKALANAGVASRRVCEQFISEGRVRVNGDVVTELGSRVDPEHDKVTVDGTPVQFDQSKRYVLLNKPVGVVSTMRDEQGRPDLRQYSREFPERLYNVGRLDSDSSGLLILTNDGELANILAHPSYEIPKTYVVKVNGRLQARDVNRLAQGVHLEDGFIKADSVNIVAKGQTSKSSLAEITLHSGKNRIVRRMFDHIGFPVQELVRRSFGPLQLGTLKSGELRELSDEELGKLLKLARKAEAHAEFVKRGGKRQQGGRR